MLCLLVSLFEWMENYISCLYVWWMLVNFVWMLMYASLVGYSRAFLCKSSQWNHQCDWKHIGPKSRSHSGLPFECHCQDDYCITGRCHSTWVMFVPCIVTTPVTSFLTGVGKFTGASMFRMLLYNQIKCVEVQAT